MKPFRSTLLLLLLFFSLSLSAQRVHYKDNYYTLVNSKIFHLGHNVYGKLTQGERDTLYMIARELYNDKGKMKPQYKARRKRDRYKLPDGFWEQKNVNAAENVKKVTQVVVAEVANKDVNDKAYAEAEPNEKVEKLQKETELLVKDTEQVRHKTAKQGQSKQEVQKVKAKKAVAQNEKIKNEEQVQKEKERIKEKQQVKQRRETVAKLEKEEQLKREKEQKHNEEKLIKTERKEQRKEEKAERKEEKKQKQAEREQRKVEKEQKQKEKELKAKEKAIKNHSDAKKKLKKTEAKYKKLKALGELSPNDEAEWLEKIEKLKENVEKAEKKVD